MGSPCSYPRLRSELWVPSMLARDRTQTSKDVPKYGRSLALNVLPACTPPSHMHNISLVEMDCVVFYRRRL